MVVEADADKILEINSWHTVQMLRKRGKGRLFVDGRLVGKSASTKIDRLDINGKIYVGGVQDWDKVSEMTKVISGFNGCIEEVRFYPISSPAAVILINCLCLTKCL